MSGHLKELDDNSFNDNLKNDVVLVDFWAPWCGPCRMQLPIMEKVADKIGDRASVAKVNVDEGQQTASAYGISSIPTLILFKGGKPVKHFVGVQSEDVLVSAIEEQLS